MRRLRVGSFPQVTVERDPRPGRVPERERDGNKSRLETGTGKVEDGARRPPKSFVSRQKSKTECTHVA